MANERGYGIRGIDLCGVCVVTLPDISFLRARLINEA
jgi:hypothetical protein